MLQKSEIIDEVPIFNIGYHGFLKFTNFMRLMPYPLRWIYWSLLWYYNKKRYPRMDEKITLKYYRINAKNKQI